MHDQNIIVLDLETKKSFEQVGGFRNLAALGVSMVGVYSYPEEKYQAYFEQDFAHLKNVLMERPLVIGFNQRRFDMPVLQPYFPDLDLQALPMIDILEDMQTELGHRVKLDSVAQATLNTKKSGDGLDAIRYWENGELDKLKKYCLMDVKITKEVFEFGCQNGEIFFMDKFGIQKKHCSVAWKLQRQVTDAERQINLF